MRLAETVGVEDAHPVDARAGRAVHDQVRPLHPLELGGQDVDAVRGEVGALARAAPLLAAAAPARALNARPLERHADPLEGAGPALVPQVDLAPVGDPLV